jgi:hypothetical protein
VLNFRALASVRPAPAIELGTRTEPIEPAGGEEAEIIPADLPASGTPAAVEENRALVEAAADPAPVLASVSLGVPFIAQAPDGEWDDPRQQDGCEEASVIMAMAWAKGEKLDKKAAKQKILELADFQEAFYGSYHDTSARDTIARLFEDYFDFFDAEAVYDFQLSRIVEELQAGRLVIIPADGQRLGNPNFTAPGPERHMLVIKGYVKDRKEFITNDPGTRKGENYRYNENVLYNAIRDYPTGDHAPITEIRKAMIVVKK